MKLKLLIPIFFFYNLGISQVVSDTTLISGLMRGNYFIFDRPANPEGKGLELLYKESKVFIVGVVSTDRPEPQDKWFHCFYKNIEGFIPTIKVEVIGQYSDEQRNYLMSHKNESFPERFIISKKISARDAYISDSTEKKEKEIGDSLGGVLESLKGSFVTVLGKRARQEKLLIVNYSYPKNILDYPGFNVRFINGSNKTIKYVYWKIVAYNAVDDIEGTKEVKCIGKVAPFDNAEYHFDDVFFSKVTDHYKIPTVRVQYMDNTIITLNGERLRAIHSITQMDKLAELGDFEMILAQLREDNTK